ncbi:MULTISPECIES: hypothetical protein [unclassified Spiroplasma]|uniref:hypothetical protein n=1 Tax=unclassified Spiroplasma TaxID=2637901 RepID=UPI0030CAFCFD
MNITESIKFDKIKEENEKLKKELVEKDKQIKNLEKEWEILVCDKYELQQTQLYKENFTVYKYCINCRGEEFPFDNKCRTCGWERIINLKDNSLYDRLPSKKDKTCI